MPLQSPIHEIQVVAFPSLGDSRKKQNSSNPPLSYLFSFFHQKQAEPFCPWSPSSVFQSFCSKAASTNCKNQQLQSLTSLSPSPDQSSTQISSHAPMATSCSVPSSFPHRNHK
jgi:hypothetical protein